ncbi:patatin-like phospholipase family protein [Exilibacterium tricleocarpae]|uniref:patatin-like phospholipase family protein n=1 Tax=Exilibacterium tricleocarpae TaxID=2591008 RepID=UPI0015D20381|nr:patatin-like phospholipase family protein [Exilibacterium tricleocarpae]
MLTLLLFVVITAAVARADMAGGIPVDAETRQGRHSQVSPCGDGSRPRIGLVLGGGGARGGAHVGVLHELERLRVPVDCIVGTSVGAIIGGFYASGLEVGEIEDIITGIDWDDIFDDAIARQNRSFRRKLDDERFLVKSKPGFNGGELQLPTGLTYGQKIELLLSRATLPAARVRDFDKLTIPYRAVAADLVTGDSVVLASGNLARAIRASMSIPAIFSPVDIHGRLLVDGGLANNLPVDVARDMGADIVIAVDLSKPLRNKEEITSVLTVTEQLTALLTHRNTVQQIATLSDKDIYIKPLLIDIGGADFARSEQAIELGSQAVRKQRDALADLALSERAYNHYLSALTRPARQAPMLDFITVNNDSPLADAVLKDRLATLEPGRPLDLSELERDIDKIFGLEIFQNVRYDIVEDDGRTGLVIDAEARSWGPNYLQFGLTLSDNFEGDNFFDLTAGYLRTGVNSLGGEMRTFATIGQAPGVFGEWYQPLDAQTSFFVESLVGYGQRNVNLFNRAGDIVSEFQVTEYGGVLAAGYEFGQWGELRLGLRGIAGDAEVRAGARVPDIRFDTGEAFLRMSTDRLDNVDFPRHGRQVIAEYLVSRETLGADSQFEQYALGALGARTWGRHSIVGSFSWFGTKDDDAPIQSRFALGGLFNLSGLQRNQLSGQHAGLAALAYYRRLGNVSFLPVYAGLTMELGNVWERESDIGFDNTIFAGSLFVGTETALGPFYLGYGRAENGREAFYLTFGRVFGRRAGDFFRD